MMKKLLSMSALFLAAIGVQAQCLYNLPYFEDFTENSTPTCWNNTSTSGGPWVFNGNPDYSMNPTLDHTGGVSGSDFAWMDFSGTDNGVILEAPSFDVGTAANVTLSFWTRSYYTGALTPYNFLYVEAFDGTNWNQVDVLQGDTGPDWVENVFDLTSHIYDDGGVNTVLVRIRAESGGASGDFNNDLALDDFLMYDANNFCPDYPENLASIGATATSVSLDWDLYSSAGTPGNTYIIEYGAPGFTAGTFTDVQNSATSDGTVTGLTAGNTYDFYVYHVCAGGDTSFAAGPVTVLAECATVSDFYVNSASTIDANVEWVSSGTDFMVEYGPIGYTPGSGTDNAVVSGSLTDDITGLTPNAFYNAYVRVICSPGDTSDYFGPVLFNTYGVGQYLDWDSECSPLGFVDISSSGTDLLLTDDSEAGVNLPFPILYQGSLIQEMTVGNNGGMILGTLTGNVGYGGNFNTLADGYIFPWGDDLDSETGNVYWEVVGAAPNRTLIVHWHNICNFSGSASDPTVDFQVQIMEATMEIYFMYNDVVFGAPDAGDDYADNASIGLSGIQDITVSQDDPDYLMNNSCVRFYYTDCPSIDNLTVTTYDVDQIGLTWDPGFAGETDWIIEWGTPGFTPGGAGSLGTINTSNNFDTIPGLDQITDYDVYVYANCDPTAPLVSTGTMVEHQTAPLCANPFGISAGSAEDSVMASWNWQANGTGLLPVGFNIAYVPQGQDIYPNGTFYSTNGSIFADTIEDTGLMSSAVYNLYIQTECNTGDTSAWIGPEVFLAFVDNDSACLAQDVPVNDQVYYFHNNGANVDPNLSSIAPPANGANVTDGWENQQLSNTTWYTFVAPASGNVQISGSDQNYVGKIAVYSTSNCASFNQFTLEGANDDGVLFGNTAAPEWIVCGLTPGETYYVLHSGDASSTNSGVFSLRLKDIDFNAGTSNGIIEACTGDTVNLFNSINGYDVQYGNWTDLASTSQFMMDSLFATSVLAAQVYDFEYRVELGCAYDSIIGQVEIYPLSSAGQNGSIDACLNQPINLEQGLVGNVDLGGVWYDPTDNVVSSYFHTVGNVPGTYNYDYVAGNGVCPDDTALVVVNVDAGCDYLGVDENKIEGISVYPNPADDVLNVDSKGEHGELNLTLIDVNGRIVYNSAKTLSPGNAMKIDISSLPTGVYMLSLSNQNVKNTYRVVVK